MFKFANDSRTAKQLLDAGKITSDDYDDAAELLVSEHVVADDSAATAYLTSKPLRDWYRVKGGLFNDGETHND